MVDFSQTFGAFGTAVSPDVAQNGSGNLPTFGPGGTLLGNLTGNYGQQPVANTSSPGFDWSQIPTLPALSSDFAPSATSQGAVVTSQGGANLSAGSVGGVSPATATMPSNAVAGAQPTPASGGIASGSIGDYFLRAVIIILGFIFVAIGLNMFRPGTVPVPGLPGRHG